jgi:hypothetical protein
MLHLYYTNLLNSEEKNKFIAEVVEKCRVNYPTVRSWIAKPSSSNSRSPKPIYRGILSQITGIQEDELFSK